MSFGALGCRGFRVEGSRLAKRPSRGLGLT